MGLFGDSRRYCTQCGTVAAPKGRHGGSFIVELLLWIAFVPAIAFFGVVVLIIPAIYSVARLLNFSKVCPACAAPSMIPLDSPIARQRMNAS